MRPPFLVARVTARLGPPARSSRQPPHPLATVSVVEEIRRHWDPVPGYLNAATMGLPPRVVADALTDHVAQWRDGRSRADAFDEDVRRARAAFARLMRVPPSQVAIGPQVSVLVGLVAANLPDGARVLVPSGDFASVVFPFLSQAARGVRVEQAPLAELAEHVRPGLDWVAFSVAQSADGSLADLAAIHDAARAAGVRTLADCTQAAGWLPMTADRFDVTVTGTYKWLCAPRGSAFLTVRPDLHDALLPHNACWYAGDDVWSSIYGPDMHLAPDARRFDVSPAWPVWAGTAPALELFAGELEPTGRAEGYGARLADTVRSELGLPPEGLPVLSLPDPDGKRQQALAAAGCVVAGRAGGVRISFHLWNDENDVERVVEALR